jgi:hypothetical protein
MYKEPDQKFKDIIMEKICEKCFVAKSINNETVYDFDIDEFIKDVSHPT